MRRRAYREIACERKEFGPVRVCVFRMCAQRIRAGLTSVGVRFALAMRPSLHSVEVQQRSRHASDK
mgnify:CR=1 FL=1